MTYWEELLPEFRKGAKIRRIDWNEGAYIVCKGTFVENNLGRIASLTNSDITSDVWEFYQEPEPDWDYIIKNKCLCWFFDSNEEVIGSAGILKEVKSREKYPFIKIFNSIGFAYQHCRPVRRDEVTFYEDRKDE